MSNWKGFEQELQNAQIPYSCNELLSLHTSFKIGGPARFFCMPQNVQQLVAAVRLCQNSCLRFYLLGKGSNALFKDEGFDGVVVSTSHLEECIEIKEDTVCASSGASLMRVCRAVQRCGLSGLEFAFGIPGSIGGAVYMNAGAYGGEMKDVLSSVTVLDQAGNIRSISADELELGYRTSIFTHSHWCILSAAMQLKPDDPLAIKSKMDELMARRKDKQPLEYPSAGSTFKRPEGAFAGELIQRCGLRGARIGDAAISEKHCGFVVNLGKATCADVLQLTEHVKQIVKEQTGFTLEEEIRVIE